jgi:hypothetical protein
MELAVGVELMLFAYMVYVSMKSPSDFSSLVVVNPRKQSAPAAPAAKRPPAAPAAKAPPPVTPVAKAPPPAAPVAKAPAPPPAAPAEPAPAQEEPAVAAPPEPAAAEEAAAPPTPAPQEPRTVVMLKNPETGEIAPLPADYRFAKKWIKDALVSEGLLDRIYKNSELDRKNRTRIREALERLKAMPKYGV